MRECMNSTVCKKLCGLYCNIECVNSTVCERVYGFYCMYKRLWIVLYVWECMDGTVCERVYGLYCMWESVCVWMLYNGRSLSHANEVWLNTISMVVEPRLYIHIVSSYSTYNPLTVRRKTWPRWSQDKRSLLQRDQNWRSHLLGILSAGLPLS